MSVYLQSIMDYSKRVDTCPSRLCDGFGVQDVGLNLLVLFVASLSSEVRKHTA